jgi:hypothetical protein
MSDLGFTVRGTTSSLEHCRDINAIGHAIRWADANKLHSYEKVANLQPYDAAVALRRFLCTKLVPTQGATMFRVW